MEYTMNIQENQQTSESERRWQTVASILGILLTAGVSGIGMCWTMSWYMEYPLFSYIFVITWQLTLNILAICIMTFFVIYLWCTRKGSIGVKTEFWSTLLSFILTSASVAYLSIDVFLTSKCEHILEDHKCPLVRQQLLMMYCNILFLVVQFIFIHFTTVHSATDGGTSSLKHFCKYFCLTILLVANYNVWLAYALSEVQNFMFETNDKILTTLPCNIEIPINSTAQEKHCLKFAKPEDLGDLHEIATAFFFGCILENCLLSMSHLWHKFISLSKHYMSDHTTTINGQARSNERTFLLEDSLSVSYHTCNDVETTNDAHDSTSSIEGDVLFLNADDRFGESGISERDTSSSDGKNDDCLTVRTNINTRPLNTNMSKPTIVVNVALAISIAYLTYVIILRTQEIKNVVSVVFLHIVTTFLRIVFLFIPNLIATVIICICGQSDNRAPPEVQEHNQRPYVPHINRVILFLSATATCLMFFLSFIVGHQAKHRCKNRSSDEIFKNLSCNSFDYDFLMYQSIYSCFPFVLQLFVVLNMQSVTKRTRYFVLFRSCLTIVAICNITFWTVDSFLSNSKEIRKYHRAVFGETIMFVIMHVVYPCFTFYRMYSFEIFIEYSCHHFPAALTSYMANKFQRQIKQ